MATVSAWNPFGVSLDLTATAGTVTRKSATQFTVILNVSWKCHWSGNQTNYGMSAISGGNTTVISTFGTSRASGSSTLTGTFSISGNSAATKTVTVSFRNFNNDNGDFATKAISLSVSVPAWTSYAVKYNANGGSGAPSAQTKWKDQTLKLSTTKPTRTGYTFAGWATSASGSVAYAAGANYTANAAVTLYAKWTALTYTVKYDANGGSGAPANQTKIYGQTLTLSSTEPTRPNYTFKGWGTSSSDTTVSYDAGGSYTTNAAITLYAIWELAYTKPRITGLSVLRCDSGGTALNNGTYAIVSFSWSSDKDIASITVHWSSSAGSGSADVAASGTSGTVSVVVGNGTLDANTTYAMEIVVTDSVDSTTAKRTLNSLEALIQGLANYAGLAFGKAAELEGCVDFGPFKGYFRKDVVFQNNKGVVGVDQSGNEKSVFCPQDAAGNTNVGMDNYKNKSGITAIYGHDVTVGVSNVDGDSLVYRPYFRKGDQVSVTLRTSGFVTGGSANVSFVIPIAKPVVGNPVVTVQSGNGFVLRQNGAYTHGSSGSTFVKPASYSAALYQDNCVVVIASFNNTANVTNNAALGIQWDGTVIFS